jgi:2-methylcitrate dehydratase PrpD
MDIASKLASWITTSEHNIPEEAIEKAKMSILDTIGATLAGSREKLGSILVQYVKALGGTPVATVIGTPLKTAIPLAAFTNGAMGHCLDFGDISYAYIGFPSISVLPAALAVGEFTDSSGKDVLAAYIIGTEVACKIGAMVSPKLYEDGWHSTSIIGGFGAAAAAGKLLNLTKDEMVNALAIAASEVSGLRGNIGTMTKSFQVGRSSENGVVAAVVAKKGLTGNPGVLECEGGFCSAYKVSQDFGALYKNLGSPFDIVTPGFFIKQFPSGSATHPAINAMLKLVKKHDITYDEVVSIRVETTPMAHRVLMHSKPKSGTEGKFSIQFCLALALLQRVIKISDFKDEKANDPIIMETMEKITLSVSPHLAKKGFAPQDGPEAAIIQLKTKNGAKYREKSNMPEWRPDKAPSWKKLAEKYQACSRPTLTGESVEKSIHIIHELETLKNVNGLMELLK